MKSKAMLLISVLFVVLVFTGCGSTGEPTTSQEPRQNIGKTVNGEENLDKKTDFKAECEKNAAEYPAKMGSILYTKGDYNFTGMKYYFKGEIVKLDLIESDVADPSVWLVKNEHGYVMPIQYDRFEAKVGDTVEVWGTLSGNGYANVEGIDNVVGQTGSMHAMQVTVNGEEQY